MTAVEAERRAEAIRCTRSRSGAQGESGAPRRLRFLLEYDGAGFAGWQRQSAVRTVQGDVERALAAIVGHAVTVVGAGRTDAGCHALGQVAHAETTSRLPAGVLGRAMNAHLARDVRVRAAEDAPPGFHARFDAVWRRYDYLLAIGPVALWRRHAWEVRGPVDAAPIRVALPALRGTHDFRAFCRLPEPPGGTACTVLAIRWGRWMAGARLSIVANRFLRGMVRTIVGTLLDVGRGRRPPEDVAAVLASLDRRRAGASAPAHGLYLVRVSYGADAEPFGRQVVAGVSYSSGGRR